MIPKGLTLSSFKSHSKIDKEATPPWICTDTMELPSSALWSCQVRIKLKAHRFTLTEKNFHALACVLHGLSNISITWMLQRHWDENSILQVQPKSTEISIHFYPTTRTRSALKIPLFALGLLCLLWNWFSNRLDGLSMYLEHLESTQYSTNSKSE